jgi:hypothetical protein
VRGSASFDVLARLFHAFVRKETLALKNESKSFVIQSLFDVPALAVLREIQTFAFVLLAHAQTQCRVEDF